MSNARDDLPEPESPVITMSLSLGSSRSMFLRLWTRAPLMMILSDDIKSGSGMVICGGYG